MITLGVWNSIAVLRLSQGEPVSIKNMFWVGIFQLTESVRSRTERVKSKVSTFEHLPRTLDIDGLGPCFKITYVAS